MFRVAAVLALCALAGCAQLQVEHQSDSFNRASATSISEQALLNAVRSSLDLPLSFTKLQKFTAGSMASASVAPKAPFGFDALRIFEVAPTVAMSGGVGQIEYLDVNTAGALAKLNENLKYDAIDRYAYQGFELLLLGTLFVEYLEIHSDLIAALNAQHQRKCHKPAERDIPTCNELARLRALCEREWSTEDLFTLDGGHGLITIHNRAQSMCDFLKFQAFAKLLRLSGYWSDLVTETSAEKLKTPEGKLYAVPKDSTRQGIRFEEPLVHAVYKRLEERFKKEAEGTKAAKGKKATEAKKAKQALLFVLRSPKSLLTYLGELIALQNYPQEPFVPEIMLGKGQRLVLFRVLRDGKTRSALSVRGPDGATYSVPHPEYGSPSRDQTLRVLAIAGEVVNGAISEKDFPAPASVVVRAIQ